MPLVWVSCLGTVLLVQVFNERVTDRNSTARDVVEERLGPDKKGQKDMLASFIAHGLSPEEVHTETILSM